MPRTFAGADAIQLLTGAAGFAFGPGTIAVLQKRSSDTGLQSVVFSGAGAGTARYALDLNGTALRARSGASVITAPTITGAVADGLVLLAWGKATGTVAPRFHRMSAAGSWLHENGATTFGNATSHGNNVVLGAGASGAGANPYSGDIAWAAIWDRNLTDAEVEALGTSLLAWLSSNPVGFWILDQSATAQKVRDLTGNGADEGALTLTSVSSLSVPWLSYGASPRAISSTQELILPGAIGSSQALGTPTIQLVSRVFPTGIVSGGALGVPLIEGHVALSGIGSQEGVGTPTVLDETILLPTGIASGEALGAPTLTGHSYVAPTSIGSGQQLGSILVQSPRKVSPVGIPGADQPGNPAVSSPVIAKSKTIKFTPGHRGIPSAEALGTPKLTPGTVHPASIPSAEAVGTPSIIIPQFVIPTAIGSAEAPGTPGIVLPGTVALPAIASSEALGAPSIVRAGTIEPTGIASSEALGTPELVTLEQLVLPEGIASAEVANAPTIIQRSTHIVIPGGITSGAAPGAIVVTRGPNAPIVPTSIGSLERLGLPRITVGVPQGPVNQPPGRIANRLYDPETGVAFVFAINHSDEDPRSYDRQYEAGGPGAVGLSRQQSAGDPFHLSFRGTILDPAQKTAIDALFEYCDTSTLIYEDYSGEAYEVIIGTWDCREERGRNPLTRGLHLWRYTVDLVILRVLHGPVLNVIGTPIATPPDITIVSPPLARVPVGIPSAGGMGTPTVIGGSVVVVPRGIVTLQSFGPPTLVGGEPASPPAAAFPVRLRASGTRIVGSDGSVMERMTGSSVHCLPDYIPPQSELHEIKDRGGAWVRVVLHWKYLEAIQGTFSPTMRTQISTLLARCEAAELYAELELHLNVGTTPTWTTGVDDTAKYANGGEFVTKSLAQSFGANKVVMGFGLNETPLGSDTIRNGNNAIPYLEGVQRTMISWFRTFAPDWIGFPTLGFANQTPYPDAPRTPASPTAYNSVGGNVVIDVHHYQAGVNSSDPNNDGRQPNGMIWPTYQGGSALWQTSDHPLSYVDTAVHREQIYAFLADYVAFCNAAQIPLLVGEAGWAANNTGGKAEWWTAFLAALARANPAMVAQWIHSTRVPPGEYWASKPNGVWDPDVVRLLGSR